MSPITGTMTAMHEGRLSREIGPYAANGDELGLEREDWSGTGAAAALPDTSFLTQGPAIAAIMQNAVGVLGLCIVVVDPRLRVLYASETSQAHVSRPCAGFAMTRRGRGGGTYLSLGSRADTSELRRLVAAATAEGPTGTTCAHSGRFHPLYSPRSICLISSIADGLADPLMGGRFRNAALLIFKPFAALPKPCPELLRTLFNFTPAEAKVASDLAGGTTAEDVARLRQVGLDTIRSQIRSILSKSGAPNLRAFENRIGSIMALLPANPFVSPSNKDGRRELHR
ncbi:Uncharacterised protein [Starkeya nomas]|uniref:HTH luxR-type domain-containing protein n=1 Tax=Starkeya nomas TaxID=2666134 RepID=A0A5S9PSI8_9HYPH|nr:hypothetical protein [Starkeya nomas]CAA0107315.1 Uncharacterised protein [Starkeya nomas]